MPLSAAEMQRRYRAKRDADPERRARYLQKEKEKWQRDKASGKKKGIANMTPREKRVQRKKWRERKREEKAKKNERTEMMPTTTNQSQPEMATIDAPEITTGSSPTLTSSEHSRFEFCNSGHEQPLPLCQQFIHC